MPVDASVYGNLRQPVQIDPLAIQNKVLTLRALQDESAMRQLQMQTAQRGIDQERELADVFRGATAPDGTVNQGQVITGAAERGLGAKIPGIQKEFADIDRLRQTAGAQRVSMEKTQLEAELKRLEARNAALGSLINAPNLNHGMVVNTLAQLAREGAITQGQGFQATRDLPSNPQALRQYLIEQNMRNMSAAERLKAQLPQVELRDTGKAIQPIDVNPLTNPTPQPLAKTTTPGEDLQASTTRRGQDMTDRRERDNAASSVTYLPTADGTLVALPNRPGVGPGGVVRATPVVSGAGMQPLQGKLSESQAKELMEVNRMRAITNGALAAVGRTPSAFSFARGVPQALPFGESIAGRFDKPEEVQARSYIFNVVSGVINERAGAAQSAQELQRLRGFLPAETDNADQIAAKLQGFLQYLDDLEQGTKAPRTIDRAAPPAAAPGPVPAGKPAARLPMNFDIPTDINEIINSANRSK